MPRQPPPNSPWGRSIDCGGIPLGYVGQKRCWRKAMVLDRVYPSVAYRLRLSMAYALSRVARSASSIDRGLHTRRLMEDTTD